MDKIFPENIRIIAEPGRYVGEGALLLFSKVYSTKTMNDGHKHIYINNGIYQGYYVRVFGEECDLEPVDKSLMKTRKIHKTTFWGQSCDSCDFILKAKMHPEYKIGDWVVSRDFGAYNKEMSCNFNGFRMPEIMYYDEI